MALDISFDQFNSIASGTYNAGQIDYKGSGDNVTLKKVNAHVHYKSLNTASRSARRRRPKRARRSWRRPRSSGIAGATCSATSRRAASPAR